MSGITPLGGATAEPSKQSVSTVSVIIPTHNRYPSLRRALQSALSQTRSPDEIVVVDDGSTDETTGEIPGEFPQVRFIRQANRGVSAARNRGIRDSTGEWLAFLDSDDEWLPRKLEHQMRVLQGSGHLLVHTNEIWIRHGRRVNPMKKHQKHGGFIFRRCLPLCVISPSSVVAHRQLLETVGLFDESLPVCEDYDLWLRVCARFPVLYLDEPLVVKYGGHRDQLSRKLWGMDRFRIRALEKVIESGVLSPEDSRAAIAALLEKVDIVLAGCRKRQNEHDAETYENKKACYTRRLAELAWR